MKNLTLFVLVIAFTHAHAFGRIGETEEQVEARYGKPVSSNVHRTIDRSQEFEESPESEGPIITPSRAEDTPKGDGLRFASERLIFFDSSTSKWSDLRSRVLHVDPTAPQEEDLKRMCEHARKHLRLRFYILNDISIEVIYLDGRSVSEIYRQNNVMLSNEVMDKLIKNSFPESDFPEEKSDEMRFIRILSQKNKELQGCATYVDSELRVSTTSYFAFLKAIEVGLDSKAIQKQSEKVDGF